MSMLSKVLIACFLVLWITPVESQEQQSPLTINGGSVLAMTGKNCVALAVDKRFASGNQVSVVFNPIPEELRISQN